MSRLLWIAALLLTLTACGQEEPAAPPADEPVAAEEPAPVEEPAVEEAVEAADEVLEVVEESASEPEPEEEAIVLAKAEPPVAPAEWKYKEGEHYVRLVPTQPTLGGPDKVEVAEFFYYLCPHCDTIEPIMKRWAENKPANARFVQVPTMWNNILVRHAQMYYTHEVLARNGVLEDGPQFHATVFREIHDRQNRLATERSIQALFERFGVSPEEFSRAWGSFEVAQKMRVAQDLARRYSVSSTPTIVVNGKYRTGAAEAGGYTQLVELIDELIVRESLR